MERDYANGVMNNVSFFIGVEIEKTPAYGMKTLFVVGIHSPSKIIDMAISNKCEHIFLGANHSFDPAKDMIATGFDVDDVMRGWDAMVFPLLMEGYLVSLDFDLRFAQSILESGYNEYNNFIPQISVKIPHVRAFNYNAMLKIDDMDFKATNPGVWCHPIHSLLERDSFTDWRDYGKDDPL